MSHRLTIICGAYGSGKTEFAMAYAVKKAAATEGKAKTGLVDLDIVNPYFRSRDLATELEAEGVMVVSTPAGLETADLPALSP
ncbi:MAG TPA: ATP-binding protein, partial [Bacillota bacterium]